MLFTDEMEFFSFRKRHNPPGAPIRRPQDANKSPAGRSLDNSNV